MLVHQFLESQAKALPENIAVVNLNRRINYSQLDESANKLANHLIAGGIKPGDRVGILIESSIDYVISFFAILKAGGAVVGLNTDTTPRILRSVLSDCAAAGIIVRQNLMTHLKTILGELKEMRVMVIDGEPEQLEGISHIAVANFEEIIKEGKAAFPGSCETTRRSGYNYLYLGNDRSPQRCHALTRQSQSQHRFHSRISSSDIE